MSSILKVDTLQDTGANTILASDGSGNLTTQKINYPAFEAYIGVNNGQSLSENTITLVEFDTEVFDTDNCYDNTTNYRFTPTIAGKYFVYTTLLYDTGTNSNIESSYVYIRKNGSIVKTGINNFLSNPVRMSLIDTHTILEMNGSSDYIDIAGRMLTSNNTGLLLEGDPQWEQATAFGAYRIGD